MVPAEIGLQNEHTRCDATSIGVQSPNHHPEPTANEAECNQGTTFDTECKDVDQPVTGAPYVSKNSDEVPADSVQPIAHEPTILKSVDNSQPIPNDDGFRPESSKACGIEVDAATHGGSAHVPAEASSGLICDEALLSPARQQLRGRNIPELVVCAEGTSFACSEGVQQLSGCSLKTVLEVTVLDTESSLYEEALSSCGSPQDPIPSEEQPRLTDKEAASKEKRKCSGEIEEPTERQQDQRSWPTSKTEGLELHKFSSVSKAVMDLRNGDTAGEPIIVDTDDEEPVVINDITDTGSAHSDNTEDVVMTDSADDAQPVEHLRRRRTIRKQAGLVQWSDPTFEEKQRAKLRSEWYMMQFRWIEMRQLSALSGRKGINRFDNLFNLVDRKAQRNDGFIQFNDVRRLEFAFRRVAKSAKKRVSGKQERGMIHHVEQHMQHVYDTSQLSTLIDEYPMVDGDERDEDYRLVTPKVKRRR